MFLILRAHNYINVHFLWSVLVEWPFNAKSSAVFPTAYLPDTPNPTHARTHTHTHPSIVSPYIYLTALRAPSKTFMTIWLNQQRQIISFPFFFLLMSAKGSGYTDLTDVQRKVSGSVVSWLDEQMQTWLPLCESSLLTTVTKIQSEVFLPVYITKPRVGSRNLDLDQQFNVNLFY